MYNYHLHRSSQNNQFFWNLKSGNHESIGWSGETYVAKSSCQSGLNLFRDNATSAPINDLTLSGAKPRVGQHEFEVYLDVSGEYRWRFQAANNQIVATSGEGYKAKQSCLNGISLAKQNARSTMIDHTLQTQSV